jgi:hypothetical protein
VRYEIRAMAFAEVLDTGFRLLRDHFGLLIGISAALYVPAAVFQAVMQSLAKSGSPGVLLAAGALGGLVIVAVSPIVSVAITFALGEVYLGREVTIGEAFRKGLGILAPVLGTSLLAGLATAGAALLLIVPGIYVGLGFVLLSQVMVLEGQFGGAALRRSFALMKGERLRALGIFLVLSILSAVLSFGVQLALGLVPVVGPIGSGLVSALSGAFAAAVFMALYFDIRCRREAFDLEQLATLVEGDARTAGRP